MAGVHQKPYHYVFKHSKNVVRYHSKQFKSSFSVGKTLKYPNPSNLFGIILVSEAQVLNEPTASSLEILTKMTQKYSITIEQLLLIFNGFVHIIRLALKPPAAFLKSDVRSISMTIHLHSFILLSTIFRSSKMISVI